MKKLTILALTGLIPLHVFAGPLTITNPSFENPATATFDFNIADWFMANQTADAGIEAVQNEASNANVPDTDFGVNWANLANDGTNLSDITGTTLLASFDINKADFFPTAALGTATVPAFTLMPEDYTTAGEALWIHFSVLGQGGTSRPQTLFDNVNVTAIPEPGTLVLLGIALGSLAIFRRRR